MSGPFLAEPRLARVVFELDGALRVGGCSMQGWRRSMEDAHCALLDPLGDGSCSFFCVCDGHGGAACAVEVCDNVGGWLAACPAIAGAPPEKRQYAEGMAWVVGKAEEHLLKLHAQGTLQPCGSTFVGVLITATQIVCANVGDSRAVMCRGTRAIDLSRDHKPSSPSEAARVAAAGGVIRNGRLGGLLAMTRALGDFALKVSSQPSSPTPPVPAQKQALLAIPEVSTCSRVLAGHSKNGAPLPPQEATFIVLACDGIWDCLSSQEVVDFFLEEQVTDPNVDAAHLCESLCRMVVAPRLQPIGSDNMTIMVIVTKRQGGAPAADQSHLRTTTTVATAAARTPAAAAAATAPAAAAVAAP